MVFSPVFYLISGGVLVLLGANSIWPIKDNVFRTRKGRRDEETSCGNIPEGQFGNKGKRLVGRFLGTRNHWPVSFSGVLFSIGWAPCALSLVFPMILLIFALGLPALQSGALLFAFGLAHGLVVIPSCAVSGELRNRLTKGFTRNAFMVKAGFAGAVIVMGLLFALRFWGLLMW